MMRPPAQTGAANRRPVQPQMAQRPGPRPPTPVQGPTGGPGAMVSQQMVQQSMTTPSNQMLVSGDLGSSEDYQLMVPYVQVTACGRSLQVPSTAVTSISNLQVVIQQELTMMGQTFEFFDVHGKNLSTDGDLRDAVTLGRTPLAASLSEASIHYIENRREELSQMQWKLVRDQLSGLSDQIKQLNRKVQEMNDTVETHKIEVEGTNNRMRHEMNTLVDNVKDLNRQNVLQLVERVDAVSHLIHSERNVREAAKQGIERQIQGVRDAFEADKSARRSEATATASLVEDCQQGLREEMRSREAFEDRHNYDVQRLSERIEALGRMQAEKAQDFVEQIKEVQVQVNNDIQENLREVIQIKAFAETVPIEIAPRLQKLEDRAGHSEGRIAYMQERLKTQYEELWVKTDKLSSTVEQVRLEERGKGLVVKQMLSRVDELEENLKTDDMAPQGASRLANSATATGPQGLDVQAVAAWNATAQQASASPQAAPARYESRVSEATVGPAQGMARSPSAPAAPMAIAYGQPQGSPGVPKAGVSPSKMISPVSAPTTQNATIARASPAPTSLQLPNTGVGKPLSMLSVCQARPGVYGGMPG